MLLTLVLLAALTPVDVAPVFFVDEEVLRFDALLVVVFFAALVVVFFLVLVVFALSAIE